MREDSENYLSLNGFWVNFKEGMILGNYSSLPVSWYTVCNNDTSNMLLLKIIFGWSLHNLSYEHIFRIALGWGDLPILLLIIMPGV